MDLDSPRDEGVLEMIVRRPDIEAREVLDEGQLDVHVGLVGDNWGPRGSTSMPDGSSNPEAQITLMNARVIARLAGEPDRWALAGDQLYVDLDLSVENLPAGTHLAVGSAVIEITAKPHTGCAKFSGRFGVDALRFVNSEEGRAGRFRGANAKVVQSGTIRRGDVITKA